MANKAIYKTIRSTVDSIVPDTRILLFGSQATGKANEHSDYDIVVITKRKLPKEKRDDVWMKLHNQLVTTIHSGVDLLIKSEVEAREGQKLPGHIMRAAFREGIFL
ncbi:MAG: nucleotidyltransferase domain-containing protein [Sphingobacteriia bacterium]|nr:nucleotidyltransferase domain-containing protein [Sphingobacteriia bacterium]